LLVAACSLTAAALDAAPGRKEFCYVGSAKGGPGNEALHVIECDAETGAIRLAGGVGGFQGTTYFELDAEGRYLYTAGVGVPPRRGNKADALRFPVSGAKLGPAERIGELSCEAPCHIALHPGDGRPFYAAYSSATLSAVASGGAVESAVLGDEGAGPDKERQKKAYAHAVFFTPDRKTAGVVNLGCDRIHLFDAATLADTGRIIRLDPGDGPRHAVWSRCARRLYVLNELSNSVAAFSFSDGEFARIGKWSTLPEGFKGWSKAAAIKLTADGKVLMTSNRGHDSIAFFAVDPASGGLSFRGASPLTGSFPRDFELMPGEKFMVVGHKRSDEVRAYRFDRERFAIEPVGEPVKVWRPLCFKFAPAEAAR
jgi:6-phosphogluconolactonase